MSLTRGRPGNPLLIGASQHGQESHRGAANKAKGAVKQAAGKALRDGKLMTA
jgi:hypothetical protein